MNGGKILALEFFASVAIVSVNTIKYGFWPLPPDITKISVSYSVLGALAVFQPEIAAFLAAGFLLAQILGRYHNGQFTWYNPEEALGEKGIEVGIPQTILNQMNSEPANQRGSWGAQWWGGNGVGFVYEPLPITFTRKANKSATGTIGATSPDATNGVILT